MTIAITQTATLVGVDAHIITVEADMRVGTAYFSIVGLPDNMIRESRERVVAALSNTIGYFPIKKIVINLAPADLKKQGTGFDVPIALALLEANESLGLQKLKDTLCIGELSLSGDIKAVPGALSVAMEAKKQGVKRLLLAPENAEEAAMIDGLEVYSAENLSDLINFINGNEELKMIPHSPPLIQESVYDFDFSEVAGQEKAKRSLEIAAAGGHNLLFSGPPGSGKTMLARRFPSILPPLSAEQAVDVTRVYSASGMSEKRRKSICVRPFRAPHHSISNAGLIGGGVPPKPGEISLAHHGVLFLDEFPEFNKNILEMLRQPLEDRHVVISRVGVSLKYPTQFQLIAAMNPCPCGFYGDRRVPCRCAMPQIQKYQDKISEPLRDRIDLQIEVSNLEYDKIHDSSSRESSEQIRRRVVACQEIQKNRFSDLKINDNASMSHSDLEKYCQLDRESNLFFKNCMDTMKLSNRAHDRILKVTRTIADLENKENILSEHLAEAVSYRLFGRERSAG